MKITDPRDSKGIFDLLALANQYLADQDYAKAITYFRLAFSFYLTFSVPLSEDQKTELAHQQTVFCSLLETTYENYKKESLLSDEFNTGLIQQFEVVSKISDVQYLETTSNSIELPEIIREDLIASWDFLAKSLTGTIHKYAVVCYQLINLQSRFLVNFDKHVFLIAKCSSDLAIAVYHYANQETDLEKSINGFHYALRLFCSLSKKTQVDSKYIILCQSELAMTFAAKCLYVLNDDNETDHNRQIKCCLDLLEKALQINNKLDHFAPDYITHQKNFVELIRKCVNGLLHEVDGGNKIMLQEKLLKEYRKLGNDLSEIEFLKIKLIRRNLILNHKINADFYFKRSLATDAKKLKSARVLMDLQRAKSAVELGLNLYLTAKAPSRDEEDAINYLLSLKELALIKLTLALKLHKTLSPELSLDVKEAIALNDSAVNFSEDPEYNKQDKSRFYQTQRKFVTTLETFNVRLQRTANAFENSFAFYQVSFKIISRILETSSEQEDKDLLIQYVKKFTFAFDAYLATMPSAQLAGIAENDRLINLLNTVQTLLKDIRKKFPFVSDQINNEQYQRESHRRSLRRDIQAQIEAQAAQAAAFFNRPAYQLPPQHFFYMVPPVIVPITMQPVTHVTNITNVYYNR